MAQLVTAKPAIEIAIFTITTAMDFLTHGQYLRQVLQNRWRQIFCRLFSPSCDM
jgi:hypothetical protein